MATSKKKQSYVDSSDFAKRVAATYIAGEAISLGDLVRLDSSTHAFKAVTDSYVESKVIGIALNSASLSNNVKVLLFGVYEEAGLAFPVNEPLFLQGSGGISLTSPSSSGKFITNIGQSLGNDLIFINIRNPIEIL